MLLVYMTVTGQTRKFIRKVDYPTLELSPVNPFVEVDEDFILIAPTYEKEVTDILWDFMDTSSNAKHCKGVFGGGNRNFAELFGFTAKDIARDYNVPLLHLFEFQGSKNDVLKLREEVERLAKNRITQ